MQATIIYLVQFAGTDPDDLAGQTVGRPIAFTTRHEAEAHAKALVEKGRGAIIKMATHYGPRGRE